jgi:hypothetical protein
MAREIPEAAVQHFAVRSSQVSSSKCISLAVIMTLIPIHNHHLEGVGIQGGKDLAKGVLIVQRCNPEVTQLKI